MNCLVCPSCLQPYQQSPLGLRVPRVLLQCGHTLCQVCITNKLTNDHIVCPQCHKTNQAISPQQFPVNQTLLAILNSNSVPQSHLCPVHKKKLQAYCEKDQEFICVQCTLSTHRLHKACLISQKAKIDRSSLKQCLKRIEEGLKDLSLIKSNIDKQQGGVESAFLDYQAQVALCFKNIRQQMQQLQDKQLEKLLKDKNEILAKLEAQRKETEEKTIFFAEMHDIYNQIITLADLDFLRQQAKRALIIQNCRLKKNKQNTSKLDFKTINCLQQISNFIQERITYEKKVSNHIHASPSNKKPKQPAILQVDLTQQYLKRKISQKESAQQTSKIKATKKTIVISTDRHKDKNSMDKSKIFIADKNSQNQAVMKQDRRYIREGSQRKSDPKDQLELSHNQTPVSISSFMRSSRASQLSILDESSFKQSFMDFSQFALEQKIFHFGGRVHVPVQKYVSENGKSQKLTAVFNRKGAQAVMLKSYSKQRCLLVGGIPVGNTQENGCQIYEFNFKTQKLHRTSICLSSARSGMGCVVRQQHFYIIGGRTDKPTSILQRYTPMNGKIEVCRMPSMKQTRQDLGHCLGFDGFLYVAGGVNHSNNILNSCERYDFNQGIWDTVAPMRFQRRGFTMLPVPHGLFVIGGHSSSRLLNQVELFDFDKGQWVEMNPMKEARCYHSAVVSKDYQTITVFGGFNNNNQLDSIEIYDIQKGQWSSGGIMKNKRCLHTSIAS